MIEMAYEEQHANRVPAFIRDLRTIRRKRDRRPDPLDQSRSPPKAHVEAHGGRGHRWRPMREEPDAGSNADGGENPRYAALHTLPCGRSRNRPRSGCADACRRDAGSACQRLRELRSRREAIGREFGQRGEHGVVDARRHRIAQRTERGRALCHHARHDRLHTRAREWGFAGEHFVRDRAERVDVGARVDGAFPHRRLGTHVLWRAEGESGLRHPSTSDRLHRERNAEIRNEGLTVVEQDVLGLDIPVYDTLSVRIVQGTRHFPRDAHSLRDGELLLALQPRTQRLAGHDGHHVIEQSLGVARVEQRQNVRMLQPRGGLDLRQEPLAAERRTQVWMQDFDGHLAIVLVVVREVDGRHTAGTELALDAVAVGQRRSQFRDYGAFHPHPFLSTPA